MLEARHVKSLTSKGFEYADHDNGNRFIVKESSTGAFAIGRLSIGGSGHSSVKVGSTRFDSLSNAVAKLTADTGAAVAADLESVRTFLDKSNALAASHVYGDAFAVTHVSPQRGWRWQIAKITKSGIDLLPETYGERGEALAVVHKIGGEAASLDLSSLKCRPIGLFS